jgi:hypothetical protein
MDEKKVLKLLSINEYDIIGSSIDNNIKYKSDVDAQEFINYKKDDLEIYNDILKHFQYIFESNIDNNNVYIIDFKCGVNPGNVPIRWNNEDIMNGYKIIEDNKINFIDCLQEKSIIKIDLIVVEQDGLFHDITYNYYFKFKNFSTNPRQFTLQEIINSLIIDVKNYQNQNKLYKSLKRLYSLYKLMCVSDNKKNLLLKIINSKLGKLNKLLNQLSLVVEVINNKYKIPNINDIHSNIQYVINNIDNDYLFLFKKLSKINKKIISRSSGDMAPWAVDDDLVTEINIIIEKFNTIINHLLLNNNII